MTDRAITLAMNKLEELSRDSFGRMDNNKAIDILNNSVMNGWQGLFPLQEQKKSKIEKRTSVIDEWRDA